jgi:pimeloyl-ACP methyl ester carboxylesterase
MPHVTRDGLRLHYERTGRGERELVLVHGWCCDHRVFAPLVEHFGATHTVTTPDLRGCGASDQPAGDYDVATLADDVAWLCGEVGIDEPVVAGHSLGGMIAVELAARHPGLPAAVVALDPGPITSTPEARQVFSGLAEQLEGPDGEAVRAAYVRTHVVGGLETEQARALTDTMCAVPVDAAAAMLRGTVAWNGLAALVLAQAPLLILLAQTRGSNAPERLLAYRPDVHIGVTVGAGHFHHVEVPDQIIPMIERFLDLVVPAT